LTAADDHAAQRYKIVKGRLGPVPEAIAPLATILTKRFNTPFASIDVDPASTEHPLNNVDAIKDV
jgi:hypothetical protein